MSHCRSVGEIDLIKSKWIPDKIVSMNQDLTLEEFVLNMRNGSVFTFINEDTYSEAEKLELTDLVEEARETLIINGFIRSDIFNLANPELYFTLNYLVKTGLADNHEEVFLPYFFSNESYEKYDFCYERMEGVIDVLSDYLSDKELYEVATDVMYMDSDYCNSIILDLAKKAIVEQKDEILPDLEEIFSIF